MIVKSIKLINFRNYKEVTCEFNKGVNYLYGENASGKTSLVEAIYYLSLARSFRTSNDSELIANNSKEALIYSEILQNEKKNQLNVLLSLEGKKMLLNGNKVGRISELSSIMNAIYFIPKDVLLLKEAPKGRRLFLDLSIAKTSNNYVRHIKTFEKLLKSRNEELKKINFNKKLLSVLTEQLINESKIIYVYRRDYINKLNEKLKIVFKELTKSVADINIHYVSFINNEEAYKEVALKMFDSALENDIRRGQTSIGVQKDDFYLSLNNKNIGIYGSQGENRISVLALKLTPYFLVNEEELKPVVILDDVLSELDENHKNLLLKFLSQIDQVFITSTSKIIYENTHYYLVSNNEIRKE